MNISFQFCFCTEKVAEISAEIVGNVGIKNNVQYDDKLFEKLQIIQEDRKFRAFLTYNNTQLHQELGSYFIDSVDRYDFL